MADSAGLLTNVPRTRGVWRTVWRGLARPRSGHAHCSGNIIGGGPAFLTSAGRRLATALCKTVMQRNRMEMAPGCPGFRLTAMFLFCLSCTSLKGCSARAPQDASNLTGSVSASLLPLPEPTLVNDYLLSSFLNSTSNTTDAKVLGDGKGTESLLQVVRCQSLSMGPSFDFYQVQAPSQTCKRPPPLISVEHKRRVRWPLFPLSYVIVAVSSLFVTFCLSSLLIVVATFAKGLAHCVSKSDPSCVQHEASITSTNQLPPIFEPATWAILKGVVCFVPVIALVYTKTAAHLARDLV